MSRQPPSGDEASRHHADLGASGLLDQGTRRIHYEAAGDGAPTVVFESGLGMAGVVWGLVQPLVAARTSTVVYDRAGIGRSDEAPGPRTLEALAADLGALLDSMTAPFVLVGHSWGGPIVRVAAANHLRDVVGLVLIDPSDERDESHFTAANRRRMKFAGPLTTARAALGGRRGAGLGGQALPAPLRVRFHAEHHGRRAARHLAAEVRELLPGLDELRTHPPELGDLPVTIISAGRAPRGHRAAHEASAAALLHGRLVVAHDAGHTVMLERPQLVADEILRLL